MTAVRITPDVSKTPARPIWCAGCGHFGVESALKVALQNLDISTHETLVLAGIGCSGTIQNNLGTYGYHALHGRVVPTATGAALSNPRLTVIAAGGDGDGYAIGAGHLLHAFRRNLPFVYIVMNNETYGLTKGQTSPTRLHEYESHTEQPIDAMQLGLSIEGTTFLARGYAGAFDQLVRLTEAAIAHARSGTGFAFLEVISPCVTYFDAYARWESRLANLENDESYDPSDRAAAFARSHELTRQGLLPTGQLFLARGGQPATGRTDPAGADLSPNANADLLRSFADAYRVNQTS